MSDDGEDFEGEFDEEIYDEELVDSDNEDKKSVSSSEEEIENDEDIGEIDIVDATEEIDDKKIVKKFKDTKKIKINTVLQKSNIPRNIIVVQEQDKRTDNRLHRSECSNVLSMRAKQIATYGTHFASPPISTDVTEIAIKELFERKCPLMLRRIVGTASNGDTIVEIWDINTMTLPPKHTI